MNIQLTHESGLGRVTAVVDAASTIDAVRQLCADARLMELMAMRPFGHVVILASPHESCYPGVTKTGERTQAMLQEGMSPADVARQMQKGGKAA